MRVLHLGLFAEGPTDHQFLGQVLVRLSDDLCRRRATEDVATPPMLELHTPPRFRGRKRGERIHGAVAEVGQAVDILFVHADSDGDATRARSERISPAWALVSGDGNLPHVRGVAVVPVQATEAWCLVDGEAVRHVFRTTLDDRDLGLPSTPRAAERLPDPKVAWQEVARRAGRRRSRTPVGEYYAPLGARIALPRLRGLAAFAECERDLSEALVGLGYIRSGDGT